MDVYKRKPWAGSEDSFRFQVSPLTFKVQNVRAGPAFSRTISPALRNTFSLYLLSLIHSLISSFLQTSAYGLQPVLPFSHSPLFPVPHSLYPIRMSFKLLAMTIRVAMRSLRRNVLRSILTMLGIIFGVGAKARHILVQFLVEASILSLAGGLLGVVFGVGSAHLVARFAHWPSLVSPVAVIGSLAFSGVVGIIFGYYPAYKASRLDPIEALRYE